MVVKGGENIRFFVERVHDVNNNEVLLENVVGLADGAANKVWLAVVKRQCCNLHGEDGSGASEGLTLVVCKFLYIVLAFSKLPTTVDRRICGDGNGDGIGCKEGIESESIDDGSGRSHKVW